MRLLLRCVLELTTILLGLALTVVGFLQPTSTLVVVLGVFVALIALVVLLDDVNSHYEERNDFRKKLVGDATRVVGYVIQSTSFSQLSTAYWIAKSEGIKVDLLGDTDYALWKQFYDNIDTRNRYCEGPINWEIFAKLNRAIYESFLTIHNEVSWVKKSVPDDRIADLQARARESVTI